MKRIFSFLLASAMLFGIFSVCVGAADGDFTVNISAPRTVSLREHFTVRISVDDISIDAGGLKAVEFDIRFKPYYMLFVDGSDETEKSPSRWSVDIDTSRAKNGIISVSASASSYSGVGLTDSGKLVISFELEALSGFGGESELWCDGIEGLPFSSDHTGTLTGVSTPVKLLVSTQKREVPAAPTLMGKSETSVYLVSLGDGYEYSLDLTNWQKSTTFTGLTPGKTYSFYARASATETMAASDASLPLTVTLPASSETTTETTSDPKPVNPIEVERISLTSIKIKYVEGRQYSIDMCKTWQDSNEFTGLTPNTMYVIYVRESDTKKVISNKIVSTLEKRPDAPHAPTLLSKTGNSVTLVEEEGCEYSIDMVNWQRSGYFDGLEEGKGYTFFARYTAEYAGEISEMSEGLTVVTLLTKCLHQSTRDEIKDSTCAVEGYSRKVCEFCGEIVSSAVIGLKEHQIDSRVTKEPSCIKEGENEFYCIVCGTVIRAEAFPMTAHQTETIISKQATETEAGLAEIRCKLCGTILGTSVIDPIGGGEDPEEEKTVNPALILVIILVAVVVVASLTVVIWMLTANKRRQQKRFSKFKPRT